MNEGHLSLESQVGSGTTFKIHLPKYTSDHVPTEVTPIPTPRIKGRIVVVDDEVFVANFIGELLRDKGYPTVVFHDSPKAQDYLIDNMDSVALLVTDGSMPVISGIELLERCRNVKADLPVIFITAYAQEMDLQAIRRLRVNTFLRKPFSIDDLLTAVGKLVELEAAETS